MTTSATRPAPTSATLAPLMERTINRLTEVAGPSAVFGAPVVRDDMTVIPVCRVSVGLGFGGGGGSGPARAEDVHTEDVHTEDAHAEQAPAQSGEGLGGGGGSQGRPVAAIVLTPGQVQIRPIIDVTRVAFAGMATAVALALLIGRALRA